MISSSSFSFSMLTWPRSRTLWQRLIRLELATHRGC